MTLPRNDDAERAVLGAVLRKPTVIFDVAGRLRPEHFAHPYHEKIYGVMLAMAKDARPIDSLTVYADLGTLKDEIGKAFVMQLEDGVPSSANAPYYAGLVIEAAKLRAVVQAAHMVIAAASAPTAGANEVMEGAQSAYFGLMADTPRQTLWSAEAMTAELYRVLEGNEPTERVLMTGLPSVDAVFDGFAPGEWWLIGGRPSTGKTAIAKQIALVNAKDVPVLVFSAEMGHRAVWRRALSHTTRLEKWRVQHPHSGDYARISHGLAELGNLRLWLDDSPGISDMHVLSTARRVQMQHGLGLIVIDYLQLLKSAGRHESRRQELEALTRSLKEIARTLEVPIVTLASLSRAASGERPNMSHIRDVGTAEYDADGIMLVHRNVQEQQALGTGQPSQAELIIEKQRNGPTGPVPLLYFGEHFRFESQVQS